MSAALNTCLTEVAGHWLDRQYPLRQEALALAASEFCLSPASFELALDWIFSQWTESRIREIIIKNPYKNSAYAAQILAGNTPAMIAQGFLQGAVLNIPQIIKIPSRQAQFADLLQRSFAETSPHLSALFELISHRADRPYFYQRLAQADLVLAYGQDETLDIIQAHLAANVVFVRHGHAESAAIISKEAANSKHLEKLAYDMLSYDQRGCLSPRVVFIETGGELNPAACAKIFAEKILPSVASQLPRGGLFPGEAAEILHQRNIYGFRGQVYTGNDWTICYDEELVWPSLALPRFLPFKPFTTIEELASKLASVKQRLISLGYAGPKDRLEFLQQIFKVRSCCLGKMQKQLLVF